MARKSLNLRFAAGLGIGLLLFGGGIHLLHGFQSRRLASTLLLRAEKAVAEGRTDRAEDYFGRYLAQRPADAEAVVRYAELRDGRARTGDDRAAVLLLYERAVRLTPGRSAIRRRLAELLVAGGRFSDARVHAEALASAAPGDAGLALLLGRCEEGTGRFREAAAAYRRATSMGPGQVEAFTLLANLLRTRLGDPAGADAAMDARGEKAGVVANNPRSADAYLARARYREVYAVPGVDPAADVARALELAPDRADVRLAAARVALARDDRDAARAHLEHAAARHPEAGEVFQALADLEAGAGRLDVAAGWLRKGVAGLPAARAGDRAVLRWTLADLLIQAGKVDEARVVVDGLRGERVRRELLDYLDASALVARSRHAEAARALAALAPSLAALPEFRPLAKRCWVALARCYERLGNADQRLDAYRRAVAIEVQPDPLQVSARFGLAASLVALNMVDEALDEYRRVPNNLGASLAVARLEILRDLRRPDDQRRWEDVSRTLDAIERGLAGNKDPGRAGAEVVMLRAESLAAQGRLDQARGVLDKAIEAGPDQVDLWVALASLVGRGADPEEAQRVLDRAAARLGDRVELRQARVDHWARRGGDAAPAALASLEQGAEKFDAEGVAALRRELAAAYARLGRPQDAARLWRALAASQPEDLGARLALFDLARRAGDTAGAEAALEQTRRIEGEDGSLWRLGRALLLTDRVRRRPADRAPLAEARSELDRAARRRPSWSRVPLALAEVDELDGQPDAAIRDYLQAIIALGDRSATAIRRVAALLGERQRFAEAELVLRRLREERAPLSGDLRRLAARVAFRNQDYAGALGEAEGVVPENSEDHRDLLWLAQLRWAAGQPAEPLLRRAVALAPAAPEARLGLVTYLAGTGRPQEARAALAQAEAELPRRASLLALAQAAEVVGEPDRAGALYAEALAAADKADRPARLAALRGAAGFELRGGRVDEAEGHLREIIDLGGASTDTAWARRLLATTLARRGDPSRTLQALELLGLSDRREATPAADEARAPEDLRARARILALQPSRARRREAAATLQRLVDRNLAEPADLLLLADLAEFEGEWPRARAYLAAALDRRPEDPSILAADIRALIRHGQLAEAATLRDRLERVAAGQPVAVEVGARLLAAAGRGAEAAASLEAFAAADDDRRLPTARLAEELNQPEAAERLYRLSLLRPEARRPAAILALAQYLGRRGRVAEGLDLLDDLGAKALPIAAVGNAELSMLYGTGSAEPALRDRVERRLARAILDNPKTPSLRFDLANLRCLQGRPDEAERTYREVADQNRSLAAPLNNLAWLLALRGAKAAEALGLIDRAIALEGEKPDYLDTRGLVRLAGDQPALAARDLEDAVAASPSPDKYFHLARAYLAAGRRVDAARALAEARSRGLVVESIHPLEQASYRKLAADLAAR